MVAGDVLRVRAAPMWRRVNELDRDLTRFAFVRQGSGPAGPRVQQEIVQAGSRNGTEVTGCARYKEKLSPTERTSWTDFTWPYAFSM
jgi:hypothetical protein